MTPLDYACSHYDLPTDFICKASPGELCNWPDGNGGIRSGTECHTECIGAAAAMQSEAGSLASVEDFDRAVDETLSVGD